MQFFSILAATASEKTGEVPMNLPLTTCRDPGASKGRETWRGTTCAQALQIPRLGKPGRGTPRQGSAGSRPRRALTARGLRSPCHASFARSEKTPAQLARSPAALSESFARHKKDGPVLAVEHGKTPSWLSGLKAAIAPSQQGWAGRYG